MTSAMPKENAEGHLVWNPSVGLYHEPASDNAESYGGIIGALQDIIAQAGAVPKSYPANFAGIISALQDLDIATSESPVTPDVKPPNGNIIIGPDGSPIWDPIYPPEDGMLWFDTRQGRLFVAMDGDFWQTNGADGLAAVTPNAVAPDISPVIGQFWWDAAHRSLYVFDGQWIQSDGTIQNSPDGDSTPVWKIVNYKPEESLQTTLTLPLGRMGPRIGDTDLERPDGTGILPNLEPTEFSVQADYNVYAFDSLLNLEQAIFDIAAVTVSEDKPIEPKVGDLWYDTNTLDMSVWYDDGNTQQWAPVTAAYNYDADLDTVRSMVAAETTERRNAVSAIQEQLASAASTNTGKFNQVKIDIESLGAALRREMPDVKNFATSAEVNALTVKVREAVNLYTPQPTVETSHLATKQALSDLQSSITHSTALLASKAQLDALELQIPSITGLATRDFVRETFDNITTTFLPRGGGELTGSFTLVKDDYSAPVFDFSTAPHYGKNALKFQTALNTTTTFGTTESPYELGWQFGSEEDYCWLYNDSKVFSISKEGPACSTLILGDFSDNNNNGRVIHNKIDLKQRLTNYQFAFESMRQGVALATDFNSLKLNILSALEDV